jgi:putative photosynthetic complex assembly protein
MQEHDYEPTPGLPQALPRDERLLWQGKPDARSLLLGTFHARKLVVYFAALLGLRIAMQLADGVPFAETLPGAAGLAVLAAVAIGLLTLYSGLVARASVFTITNRRVVIRCGVALPLTVNLPFSRVDAVDVRERSDGSGEVAILPEGNSRVSYLLLWPMVKPWRFMRVRPVLRGIPQVAGVAEILAEAIAQDTATAPSVAETSAARPNAASPAAARSWRELFRYPTAPLAAASSLVVIALVATVWVRSTGDGAWSSPSAIGEPVTAAVELHFEDRGDGSVAVIDAANGSLIDVIEPETNGFLRSVLRSFARERRSVEAGADVPFSLRRTETGRLLLSDVVTGREVDLRAFGVTNAEAFGRLLYAQQEQAATSNEAQSETEASMTAAAMNKQESKQ